jgi:hypothetical protein
VLCCWWRDVGRCSLRLCITACTLVIYGVEVLSMVSPLPLARRASCGRVAASVRLGGLKAGKAAGHPKTVAPRREASQGTGEHQCAIFVKPVTSKRASPSSDLIHGAQQRRDRKLTAHARSDLYDCPPSRACNSSAHARRGSPKRLHSARASFWRRRGTRGLERPETARADAADASTARETRGNAQKLTPPQRRSQNPNHSAPKTIAVVPKASCVGSTAINQQNGPPSVE